MNDTITALDDPTAVRILTTFTGARFREALQERELTPDVRQALQASWNVDRASRETVTEGDLARQSLLVLAADPANQEGLTALIQNPPPPHFGVATAIAVTTLALLVLQTHVKIKRSKDGKVEVLVGKLLSCI
jgi:hypothetical protein